MILYVQWNLKTECDETAEHRSCLCWFECLFLISFSGLLVAYCHRFDILTQSSRIYFVACTVGMYVCRGSSEGYNGKCFVRVTVCLILSHWSSVLSLSLLFPFSLWHRPADHLCGSGCDADGPAGSALPGALHSAHQPHCSTVAQGVAPVLDWKWICGEYQFDMTAYCGRTKKDLKNATKEKKNLVLNNMQSKVEFQVE